MTTPRLGAPELTSGQATPETTVNEIVRYLEAGGGSFFNCFAVGTNTPPGSPADGVVYVIGDTPTGAWSGFTDGSLALYINTAWVNIPAHEGAFAYSQATDALYKCDGSGGIAAWVEFSGSSSGEWAPNFTSDGELYIPAAVAMTVDQGNAKIGTGTITFEKSTTAAPGTFSSTTLPATLEAGAWLKVIAASVSGFVATHLKRTA